MKKKNACVKLCLHSIQNYFFIPHFIFFVLALPNIIRVEVIYVDTALYFNFNKKNASVKLNIYIYYLF